MTASEDPFRHHPGLRDLITPPERSFFRDFRPADIDAVLARHGLPVDWRHSDAEIDARRDAFMAGHAGDLWVFGYGSLMWDPGVRFAEVRRARVAGRARAFILVDVTGGRGTPEAPGLMAALDTGPLCDGLAFRLAAETVDAEFPRIWNREMIGPAYRPVRLRALTDQGPVEAVTFAADHAAEAIRPDLSLAEQAAMVATGTGILGTSLDYLESLARHFAELQIVDDAVTRLLDAARAQAGAT